MHVFLTMVMATLWTLAATPALAQSTAVCAGDVHASKMGVIEFKDGATFAWQAQEGAPGRRARHCRRQLRHSHPCRWRS